MLSLPALLGTCAGPGPAHHLMVSTLPAESRACSPQVFALASTLCPLTSLLEQMRKLMRESLVRMYFGGK